MSVRKKLSTLLPGRTLANKRLIMPLSFMVGFALLGIITIVLTRAATPVVHFEAESGTKSSAAVIATDATASNGAAVRFTDGTQPVLTCNLTATTGDFSSKISAATAGQVICLATGNYGTWSGTNKSITITKQSGATPTMDISFGSGDTGFTIDGLNIGGGDIGTAAKNITIKNSNFGGILYIDAAASNNIILDGNTHRNINTCTSCIAGRVHIGGNGGTNSVVIRNSIFDGGNSDGIRADAAGVVIEGNTFTNIKDEDPFHSDPIQIYGGTNITIRGNLFIGGGGGPNGNVAAGIMMADGGSGNIVENNVFTAGNHGDAMTWYSDSGSIIRHNTMQGTGINLGSKSSCGGCSTTITNNILSYIGNGGGGNSVPYTSSYNLFAAGGATGTGSINGTPSYAGPVNTWLGYLLTAGSPGKNAASDGKDMGINP